MTMRDGKASSVIAESSSQKCGVCRATPTMMNDFNAVKNRYFYVTVFEYGLSTLQAWIRCFECFLHIANLWLW